MKKTIEYDSDDHVEICSISHGPDQESLAKNDQITPVPKILIDPDSGRTYAIQGWNKMMNWEHSVLRVRAMLIPCEIRKKELPKRPVLYFVSNYFHNKQDWVREHQIPDWAVRHVGSLHDIFGLDGVAFFFHHSSCSVNGIAEISDRVNAMKNRNSAELFVNSDEALDHLKSLGVIT